MQVARSFEHISEEAEVRVTVPMSARTKPEGVPRTKFEGGAQVSAGRPLDVGLRESVRTGSRRVAGADVALWAARGA